MEKITVICDAHEALRKIFLELERIEWEKNRWSAEDYHRKVIATIEGWAEIVDTATQMGIRMKQKLQKLNDYIDGALV